jgi:hypothetical protein
MVLRSTNVKHPGPFNSKQEYAISIGNNCRSLYGLINRFWNGAHTPSQSIAKMVIEGLEIRMLIFSTWNNSQAIALLGWCETISNVLLSFRSSSVRSRIERPYREIDSGILHRLICFHGRSRYL